MRDEVQEVTDATFEEEVLKSELPVLLDVWAPWCGPCKMVSPTIEALARENAGRIKACKIDVDENSETASKFGINAIPTVLIFVNGEEQQHLRVIGAQSQAAYQEVIDQVTGA